MILYEREKGKRKAEPSGEVHVERIFFEASRDGRYVVSFDNVQNKAPIEPSWSDRGERDMIEGEER